MVDVIPLKNQDIKKELIDRAHFIFWAASGSLGDSGAFRIVTGDGKSYYCNYAYGDADIDVILEACPLICEDAESSGYWEDWVFHDLGGGNFLLIRKEHEEKYNELLCDNGEIAYEYQNWHRTALKICGNPEAFDDDYEEPDPDELNGTESPEDQTVFVAWKDGGSSIAGAMSDGKVLYFNFDKGVGIEAFFPISRLKETEGWVYQDLGNDGSHILVNTRYSDIFIKTYKSREMLNWLQS